MLTTLALVTTDENVSWSSSGRVFQMIEPTDVKSGNDRVERMVRSVRLKISEIEFMVGAMREVNPAALSTMSEPET